jgi:hypothetical protein
MTIDLCQLTHVWTTWQFYSVYENVSLSLYKKPENLDVVQKQCNIIYGPTIRLPTIMKSLYFLFTYAYAVS